MILIFKTNSGIDNPNFLFYIISINVLCMKERVIGNLKKYKYDWFAIVSFICLLLTSHLLFVVLFFVSILLSEFKK